MEAHGYAVVEIAGAPYRVNALLNFANYAKNSAAPAGNRREGHAAARKLAASLSAGSGLRCNIDLHRMPVDNIEKRVRIMRSVVADDLVDVDGVAPEILIG
ncbi:hypothetical protein [Sphingopyxis sp.]|uniref:hypothetical protein n=1 Tax=Sphingopyxis sp. TaxID=1908224 RepID=UPI003BACCAF1